MKIKKTALQKATDLLANQEQSSTVLRRKLLARKYDSAEVDAAIDKLKHYKYLDDEDACRTQFERFYSEEKLGVREIVFKLIGRGFDKDFIEQLIPDDSGEHDRLVAQKLLTKKFSANFDRAKAWQFLSARGFDGEIISATIEDFSER